MKFLALLLALALGAAASLAFAYGKPQSPSKETAHQQSGSGSGDASSGSEPLLADRVVVRKSERRMYLMHGDTVLRSYRVALGLNPVGPKEQEGDSRTPEGHYQLTRRNPHSEYFLSIQVSYPNDKDLQRARRNRLTPGGAIMIHGLPNELRREPTYYEKRDWTDGCIAVSDSDMLEIWLMTPQDIPIDILP
ncbi:MAG TPA: L,D-transpeptidase family protein [Steroidobacteraceae bacterium]|nr:L,D-transpeptidase family protein [Steroidobacteraceae bacterium]